MATETAGACYESKERASCRRLARPEAEREGERERERAADNAQRSLQQRKEREGEENQRGGKLRRRTRFYSARASRSSLAVASLTHLGAGAGAVVAADEAVVAAAVLVASIVTPLLGLQRGKTRARGTRKG